MARSVNKSKFLLCERGVWNYLRNQQLQAQHATAVLAERSAEAAELRLTRAALKAEVAELRAEVAPLSARVTELEEEVARVATERDTAKEEAKREATTTKMLRGNLLILSTARDQPSRWPLMTSLGSIRPCKGPCALSATLSRSMEGSQAACCKAICEPSMPL